MIAIAAAIAAAVALGIAAERRGGARTRAATRTGITVLLWTLVPFVVFVNIARLRFTVDVGAGIALAYMALAVTAALTWWLGTRALRVPRPGVGAMLCGTTQANTGYLGLPLVAAVLGSDDLPTAIAYDALVQVPMFYLGAFAIGATFGARDGGDLRARARSFLVNNPPLLALLAALVVPDALVPDVLLDVSHTVVLALLPVGFFIVGVTLAGEAEEGALRVPPPLTRPVAAVAFLRLLLAPALLFAIALPLIDLPTSFLVLAAMPCAVNTVFIGHIYGLDLKILSESIAWTTVVAVAVGLVLAAATGQLT